MNLTPVLIKTSPRAHTESELEVLGVLKKLVKYVVQLSKRKKLNLKNKFLTQVAQTAINQFLVKEY
jgi:hypothetical protein